MRSGDTGPKVIHPTRDGFASKNGSENRLLAGKLLASGAEIRIFRAFAIRGPKAVPVLGVHRRGGFFPHSGAAGHQEEDNMAYYEHVLIARPDISPQQVDALIEDITKTITEQGGKVSKT